MEIKIKLTPGGKNIRCHLNEILSKQNETCRHNCDSFAPYVNHWKYVDQMNVWNGNCSIDRSQL